MMDVIESFQYLYEKNLPLIISFPVLEEKGHIISGKGICFIEKMHGTSRITFGRFSPFRSVYLIRNSQYFYATFEIKGNTYGCIIENITSSGDVITASIPETLSPFMRRFLRVEPSIKSPVIVYLRTELFGTISLPVRDISERGIGFTVDSNIDLDSKVLCGIKLPLNSGVFILTDAKIAYKKHFTNGTNLKDRALSCVSYGLELMVHNEDAKQIRQYIMQREIEIRRLIQEKL